MAVPSKHTRKNKMSLKAHRLPILCLILLTLMITAQPSIVSAQSTGSDYGIEPEVSYPGSLMIEILTAAEEEASIAIGDAYAEGYKVGLLEAAPEAAYWRKLAEELKKDAPKRSSRSFLWGLGAGVFGTLAAGAGIYFTQK